MCFGALLLLFVQENKMLIWDFWSLRSLSSCLLLFVWTFGVLHSVVEHKSRFSEAPEFFLLEQYCVGAPLSCILLCNKWRDIGLFLITKDKSRWSTGSRGHLKIWTFCLEQQRPRSRNDGRLAVLVSRSEMPHAVTHMATWAKPGPAEVVLPADIRPYPSAAASSASGFRTLSPLGTCCSASLRP